MQELNFPPYPIRLKNSENKPLIWDLIRKKYVVLTPEEWVRQNVLYYLTRELNYPLLHIQVERSFQLFGTTKRFDVAVYGLDGSIKILVECKAPSVSINQDTFDQIARYQLALQSTFLMVTNGLNHYFCVLNKEDGGYQFLPELPVYAF